MTTARTLAELETIAVARHICRGQLDELGRVLPVPHQHIGIDVPVLLSDHQGVDFLIPIGTIQRTGEVVLN